MGIIGLKREASLAPIYAALLGLAAAALLGLAVAFWPGMLDAPAAKRTSEAQQARTRAGEDRVETPSEARPSRNRMKSM